MKRKEKSIMILIVVFFVYAFAQQCPSLATLPFCQVNQFPLSAAAQKTCIIWSFMGQGCTWDLAEACDKLVYPMGLYCFYGTSERHLCELDCRNRPAVRTLIIPTTTIISTTTSTSVITPVSTPLASTVVPTITTTPLTIASTAVPISTTTTTTGSTTAPTASTTARSTAVVVTTSINTAPVMATPTTSTSSPTTTITTMSNKASTFTSDFTKSESILSIAKDISSSFALPTLFVPANKDDDDLLTIIAFLIALLILIVCSSVVGYIVFKRRNRSAIDRDVEKPKNDDSKNVCGPVANFANAPYVSLPFPHHPPLYDNPEHVRRQFSQMYDSPDVPL